MNCFILDTDHITLHHEGNMAIRNRLANVSLEQVAVTIISFEEQIRGWLAQIRRARDATRTIWAYRRLHETLDYFALMRVLDFDEAAANQFRQLRQRHIRVGTQDLRIAAIALATAGVVVTRNQRDFERVPGLVVEDWSQDAREI